MVLGMMIIRYRRKRKSQTQIHNSLPQVGMIPSVGDGIATFIIDNTPIKARSYHKALQRLSK